MKAGYLQLGADEIANQASQATRILAQCTLCPRECKINRLKDELGFCQSGKEVVISSAGPHLGEEPPISGSKGSGTIFFTNCNLRCVFCQNYQISQQGHGHPVTTGELADIMLSLQKQECHNINLVSPTHFVPQILSALALAIPKGLNLPLVYNTNGYDALATLKLLDGIVDIYLPDIKYADNRYAKEYSGVDNYVKHNRLALKEMYRQVGNLITDEKGIAQRGLLIRHLVLPNRLSGTFDCLDFIAREISRNAYISLMSQYHPSHKAHQHPEINRRLTPAEYKEVVAYAEKLGLENCYIQELVSSDDFLPDFQKENPFSPNSI
ncbi:MAG: radical SAM protein [Planctomycetes bacterium]|nr:radical SAM protein [Planctomycetota bacterium]